MHCVKLDDPKVAAVVRRCQQLPGQELFQYLDDDRQPHTLGSGNVNDYIAEISATRSGKSKDPRFTAKDFRTWHGSVQALELTRIACGAKSPDQPRYSAKAVLDEVARLIGNTPAVCRKSYVHPAVMELGASLVDDDEFQQALRSKLDSGKRPARLSAAEIRLLAFLRDRRRLARRQPKAPRR